MPRYAHLTKPETGFLRRQALQDQDRQRLSAQLQADARRQAAEEAAVARERQAAVTRLEEEERAEERRWLRGPRKESDGN